MNLTKRLLNLRYQAEALALRVAVWLFRLIPVDAASALMGFFWRKIAPLNPRHKRALKHLELAFPESTAADREKIVMGMWDNLGRVAAETFHIPELIQDDSRFEFVADEVAASVISERKAAVFVSLHSGNWELCVRPATRLGVSLAGVYQALKNPFADKVLRDLRGDLYGAGLYSKGHETARKLVSIVRQGGIVAIMSDLREVRGVRVPFFGREAYANPVPASLARSCGVPVIAGRVVRQEGARFRIEARGIPVPQTGDRKADVQQLTEEIHQVFEDWIRENPDQWMWIHRKWAGS